MQKTFKPYTISFGKKYYGIPFNDVKDDKMYNQYIRSLPDNKKTKGMLFYLNWLDKQNI